jgi:hypothetical protein
MIDIYRMTPEQTIEMIEQLRKEVGWTKFGLLRMIREQLRRHWAASLEEALKYEAKSPELITELWWHLVDKAPFRIKLDNLDDREGCVMIDAESKILAVHDQSIAGAHWEAPDDMDGAYAMPGDHPGLLEELKKEGYEIDDSEYCPPDPEEWVVVKNAEKIKEAVDEEIVEDLKSLIPCRLCGKTAKRIEDGKIICPMHGMIKEVVS